MSDGGDPPDRFNLQLDEIVRVVPGPYRIVFVEPNSYQ